MSEESQKINTLPQSIVDEVMTWRISSEEKEILLVDLDDYFRSQIEELSEVEFDKK